MAMRFCPECNFMLYPKDDSENSKLIYYCKTANCSHTEPSDDPYVFRNQIVKSRNVNLDIILPGVTKDPTLARTECECPKCGHNEAVLIQSTQNVKSNKLTLIFVCTNDACGKKWTDEN